MTGKVAILRAAFRARPAKQSDLAEDLSSAEDTSVGSMRKFSSAFNAFPCRNVGYTTLRNWKKFSNLRNGIFTLNSLILDIHAYLFYIS